MTETALQFGPEWMRALCDRGPSQAASNSPTPAPAPTVRYKLAEYRYGREEMLALFEQNSRPADDLRRENPALVKESCQLPLALIPMTEEETALWATSVNSEAVLRISNKDRTAVASSSSRPPLSQTDRLLDGRDTRPGPRVDGRAPGFAGRSIGAAPGLRGGVTRTAGAAVTSSSRGFGYCRTFDDDPESDRREGSRADVLKRGTSLNEDQRIERFRPESDETKPRIRLDSRSNAENWRSSGRSTNDGSNWRSSARREESSNWKTGTPASWRDEGPEDQGDHRNGRSRYRSNDWDHHHYNDEGSNLPEWSLDDGGTTVGTFDASGAFRSASPGKELEDDGEGEWTSVPSNRTKRMHGQKDVQHPDRQAPTASRDDAKQVLREQKEGFDNSIASQSSQQQQTQSQSKQQSIRSDHHERQENEYRRSDETTSFQRSDRNGTMEQPAESTSQVREYDEDFCSIEKLTESMVMKWTEEEDAKSSFAQQQQQLQPLDHRSSSMHGSLRPHLKSGRAEDEEKWFYQDPQGELQGPFSASEMMEWFNAGYFKMNLLVRRSEDERFSELGSMIKSCKGLVPFSSGVELPPVRVDKQPLLQQPPPTALQSNNLSSLPPAASSSIPANDLHVRQMLLFQMQQQQQQAAAAAAAAAANAAAAQQQRMRQQQQMQQQLLQQQQQMQVQLRQLLEHLKRQDGFSELSQQEQQQVLLRQYTQLEQSRRTHQISAEAQQQQPVTLTGRPVAASGLMSSVRFQPPVVAGPSIWELSNGGVMTSAALEEIQRREQEEQERKEEQKRKLAEEEQRRRHEAEVAKAEEEQRRFLMEQQRKEEQRQKEERAKQEEELRRQQEEDRIAEEKRREEQRRRHDEMRKLEEMARKQKEEADRSRQKEEEEKIRQMQKQQQELDRQRHEHEARIQRQQQQQQQQQAEAMKRFQEKRGWGEVTPAGQLSLSEIQRLQEEKEFEERLEEMKQKASMRQTYYQNASHKPNLTWVQSAGSTGATTQVKTLAEIQREEAEKLAKMRKEQDEREKRDKVPVAAGIWSNAASQLTWKTSSTASAWGAQSPTATKSSSAGTGLWESDPPLLSSNNHKSGGQSGAKSASGQTGKQSSAKSRKSEDSVIKLFESQRRCNDDFSKWCEHALSKFQSALDVETFVAFLRGLESPFDVNDYIRSYLGENKDSRDFAKQFLEKRSYYRNQERKKEQQEVMWGPAPAITPSTNRTSSSGATTTSAVTSNTGTNSHNEESQSKGGKGGKKKKNKRLVDTSLLGFTVQADPDRIKSGEIESID